ncbi:DUF2007 domain-containing protein [Halieaceae bacterium IMCC14734]|uniref:DUF2007 domain-containing protein n=1 Tax=Candidatus Litorirhabdus singularis TaxID=2518993 RepID=A0ABT3TKN7_9GAMM|nr:DUF2007 domain-containing protein [Candidatus Litorirhabdus singularis]MCX2982340.1 DUF2007 domain-containing protein [Candidatus Litorirhabdus singularis]
MKLLFSHENRLVVGNIRNVLDAAGIDTVYRNEFSGGGIGEVSPFDAWLEIWLPSEVDYPRAAALIAAAQQSDESPDWHCRSCGERNTAVFELCWNCQLERPDEAGADDA